MYNFLCFSTFVSVLFLSIQAIPIDNGVVGDAEIQCGPTSVTVNFPTQNSFEGKVYVKNHFGEEACKVEGSGDRVASIELPFDSCDVKRERSINPRGIFVWTTVIVSFHHIFVTKIDRAVRIQCFYMEADKTVSQELEVSILTTELQTLQVPMPVCRYDILDGGPNGDPIKFAIIGQQVYHKWTCDTDTTDTFCMVVYDCKVDDGTGDLIQLLDDEGCALDKYLLGNLEYPTDLMGGREAHVFKYADRPNLYFNCQIRITIKEPGEDCARPQCSEPGSGRGSNRGRSSRRRQSSRRGRGRFGRNRFQRSVEDNGFIQDVSIPYAFLVADVDLNEGDIPRDILHPRSGIQKVESKEHCISQAALGLALAPLSIFMVLAIFMAVFLYLRKAKNVFNEL